MTIGIGIFAKTPKLSRVKTRLAAAIGEPLAREFYELSVACISETVTNLANRHPQVKPHWALAEEEAVSLDRWSNLPAIWTGDGGLGERLATISEKLFQTHDQVILMGTDSPQLSVEDFETVLDASTSQDVTFGPANDGGFYLALMNQPIPRAIWERVTYSASTTLEELKSHLVEAGITFSDIHSHQDVDEIEDLATLKTALQNQDLVSHNSKRRLLDWLDRNNSLS